MPSINFKGKNAIWNHHLSVPYQILEKDKKLSRKGKDEEENLIIEGDNLIALKSLLPKYQGKIKCIYIDPPYNTGNEGWIFNDKVNSPLIKEWLGKTVDKEDLTRHDKWLCMMTPRLKLLRELLSDKGTLFISIDEHEIGNLICLIKEIFKGADNESMDFIIWRKTGKQSNTKRIRRIRTTHEYIVVAYRDKNNTRLSKIKLLPQWVNQYTNPDNDPRGNYKQGIISNKEESSNPDSENYYTITTPTGVKYSREWYISEEEFKAFLLDNRIYFPRNGDGVPAKKIFENEEQEYYFDSIADRMGTFSSAKEEIAELLGDRDIFDAPKPTKLIKEIIRCSTNKDSIILDSFAGSGTSAQAVLELNKEKGNSSRKFILVQLPEKIKKDTPAYKAGYRYVHEITRDRVKRVIRKNKFDAGFSYMKLGSQIDTDSILSGKLPKYVYYLATGKTFEDEKKINEKNYFVGKNGKESIYLIYEKDFEKLKELAITLGWAEKTQKKDKNKKIVYAPACFLDEEYLEKFNISFVSIPYSLFERKK